MEMKKIYQTPTVFCTVYNESDHLCQVDMTSGEEPQTPGDIFSNKRKDIDDSQPQEKGAEWGNLW